MFVQPLETFGLVGPSFPACASAEIYPRAFGASAAELAAECLDFGREPDAYQDGANQWLRGERVTDSSWAMEPGNKTQVANFALRWCTTPWGSCSESSQCFLTRSRFLDLCMALGGGFPACETAYCLLDDGELDHRCTASLLSSDMVELQILGEQELASTHVAAVSDVLHQGVGYMVWDVQHLTEELRRQADPMVRARHQSLPYFHRDWAKLAYLIQVKREQDLTPTTRRLEATGAHVFVLTWGEMPDKRRGKRRMYFPNSLLDEGYTALWLAARLQEEIQGWVYGYYVFYDEPLMFVRGDFDAFGRFLQHREPALGAPVTSGFSRGRFLDLPSMSSILSDSDGDVYSVTGVDQRFVAIHHEASEELYPFQFRLDRSCSIVAQVLQMQMAAAKYKGRILVTDSVVAVDLKWSSFKSGYHRGDPPNCWRHVHNAREWFVGLLPTEMQPCARYFEQHVGKDGNGYPHGPVRAPPAPPGGKATATGSFIPRAPRTGYGGWRAAGLRASTSDGNACVHEPVAAEQSAEAALDGWALLARAMPIFQSPGRVSCRLESRELDLTAHWTSTGFSSRPASNDAERAGCKVPDGYPRYHKEKPSQASVQVRHDREEARAKQRRRFPS